MLVTVLLMIAGLALATLIVYAGHVTSKPVLPESVIDVDALRLLAKPRVFAERYGVPAAQIALQNWDAHSPRTSWNKIADSVGDELGYKILGNMLWTLSSEIAPRQATKIERAFWNALVDARMKLWFHKPKWKYADDGTLSSFPSMSSICRARQG